MKFSIDEEHLYSLAKDLGLEIEFNSDDSGIELLNGEVVSFVEFFKSTGFLSEDNIIDKE